MYVLKTTVEEELLVYIRDVATLKVVWDTLATLFSKKNDARLQLLESELMTISQGSMTINQYFTKVKSLCNEIAQLDPEEKISEQRMRRIIIHGLRPEYSGFMATIRGWPMQPTLLELENLLANQEALARQIDGVSPQQEEEALFGSRRKGRPDKDSEGRPDRWLNQQGRPKEKTNSSRGARNQRSSNSQLEYRNGRCYNYGKRRHYARDCWSKKEEEGNLVVATKEKAPTDVIESEEEWEGLAAVAMADKRALESEQEIDFESWFFEEVVQEATAATSCTVAVEEKPRDGATVETITEKSDDVATMGKVAEVQVISRQGANGRAIRRSEDRRS